MLKSNLVLSSQKYVKFPPKDTWEVAWTTLAGSEFQNLNTHKEQKVCLQSILLLCDSNFWVLPLSFVLGLCLSMHLIVLRSV